MVHEENKLSHQLQETEEGQVGDVGSEDGGHDGSDLDTSSILVALSEVVVDLLDEVGEVERLYAGGHGVHQVGDSTSGVGANLVGNLRPVRDDRVETAELHGIGDRSDSQAVD